MIYNILTPFSRFFNLIELGDCLKRQGVVWHLLMIKGEPTFPSLGSWVHVHYFDPPPEGFFIGHHVVNKFLDTAPIEDNQRFQVITDDDMVEEGFFKKLDAYDEDILVVSMQRSSVPTVGDGGGPFDSLIAHPRNMKTGSCGLEQLIFKGKILKNCRLKNHYEADGDLIERLHSEQADKIRFVPDAWVYFDFLYPGRGKCGRWER